MILLLRASRSIEDTFAGPAMYMTEAAGYPGGGSLAAQVKSSNTMRWWFALLVIALGGCAGGPGRTDSAAVVYPANYKADLLAFLRTYLNDPSNVRDAFIAEPSVRIFGTETRYVVCVRYEARRSSGEYAPSRERIAVYYDGRFDRFIESAREQCAGATYQPFPELERLSR